MCLRGLENTAQDGKQHGAHAFLLADISGMRFDFNSQLRNAAKIMQIQKCF